MASIGQFNAAAASLRAEATNTLMNVNLEFSLFTKRIVEPPREYAEVGQHLAPGRLHEAQEGARHTIARKLGLLFKDNRILSSTPELIKAYGLRASEISRSSAANPRGDMSHGAFAGMIGADATTLWAAATSGRPALQCHLLACLLARIWEPAEATSIWVEIVARRKEELKLILSEEGELAQDVLYVVAEEMLRSDLRDWDASVRAWMRVADSVMEKQQTQARLIIDNLSLPVNAKPDTYESVMSAWHSAMTQMERLLNGVPLQVHSGDILLALLSWHIYPDMKYLSKEDRYIKQQDPLVEGRGILTFGLEPSPRVARDCKSVYWALPLSHLRYYGRLPVTRTRSIRTGDRDRITVDEMLWAMVAAYITDWDDGSIPTKNILESVSDIAIMLHTLCDFKSFPKSAKTTPLKDNNDNVDSWLLMISRICLKYKDRLAEERVRKLKAMGQRFGIAFGGPFQNIFSVATYLKAARNLEDKVSLLREIAASMPKPDVSTQQGYEFLIVYKRSYVDDSVKGKDLKFEIYEYATACPEHGVTGSLSNISDKTLRHRRWLSVKPSDAASGKYMETVAHRVEEIKNMGEEVTTFSDSSPVLGHHVRASRVHPKSQRGDGDKVIYIHDSRREARDRQKYGDNRDYVWMKAHPGAGPTVEFEVVHGGVDSIALTRRSVKVVIHHRDKNPNPLDERKRSSGQLSVQKIMELFRPDTVKFSRCAAELNFGATHNMALLGMTFIESLYGNLKGATVDVRSVQFDLSKALWLNYAMKGHALVKPGITVLNETVPSLAINEADTATCFACIAMMETGSYNLNPDELQSVFAIGAADSLYIASALVRDPTSKPASPVKRFIGNIGRAGMAFMVPPKDPEIRSYDKIDEWYQYDHKEFDGTMEDCFKGTSLHLSFSEASQAVNIDFSGGRDVEAYFLETLISVHDRETWIAELDILGALRSPKDRLVRGLLGSSPCNCDPASARGTKIISIDNFAEMIVPPAQGGIIRASRNWQARLAAASICLAKGYKVILKSEGTCWGCLSKAALDDSTVASIIENAEEVVVIL
ncbi:hypothetical protein F4804DRAFT_317704 [Jackrogersella minutella]|nr:hypothetical protein F4804DRAFT_317704 [Jackrogersella minutella]